MECQIFLMSLDFLKFIYIWTFIKSAKYLTLTNSLKIPATQ